jgi:hypothetical protein
VEPPPFWYRPGHAPFVDALRRERAMTRLQVGDTVTDFSLPSSLGEPVSLSEALQGGPVVLAWYPFDFGRV